MKYVGPDQDQVNEREQTRICFNKQFRRHPYSLKLVHSSLFALIWLVWIRLRETIIITFKMYISKNYICLQFYVIRIPMLYIDFIII